MTTAAQSPVLVAGIDYATRGWPVLPIKLPDDKPDGCKGKEPATKNGVKDATTDADTLSGWFGGSSARNIGIACGGPAPIVLDFDRDKGDGHGDGLATRAKWEELHGPLPPTVVAITGGGGEHWFYVDPGGIRCKNNPATRFDVKASGGYIVAPPSRHRSGAGYDWKPGHAPGEVELAELPPGWVAALREYTAPTQPAPAEAVARPAPTVGDDDGPFEVAAAMDQGALLELASGTGFVDGQRIELRPSPNGKRQVWIDGKQTAAFIDASGRIGHSNTGSSSAGPDGGPKFTTWVRYYGHDNKAIRAWLIANVPACKEAAERRKLRRKEAKRAEERVYRELSPTAMASINALLDAATADAPEESTPQPDSTASDDDGAEKAAPRPADPWSKPPTKLEVSDLGGPGTALAFVNTYATRRPGGLMLRRWRGEWYQWTTARGCYAEMSADLVSKYLYQKLTLKKRSHMAEVLNALHTPPGVLVDDATELGGFLDGKAPPTDPLHLAPCRNGPLDLATGELHPATPRYFVTSTLGAAFDPAAAAPTRWLAFLDQLWPEDPESIQTLQEWFGYLLTPDTRQQKILLLVGRKRSGKGTIFRILTHLLGGDRSVAGATPASLAGNFGLQPLIGKLAVTIPDARFGGRIDTAQVIERLLSISGQDLQVVDRKNLRQWAGFLSVRFCIGSNELPRLPDASDALASRMLVLELERSWYGQEDTGLEAKLLAELPGILLWAMEGWRRLHQRGHFVQPKASAGTINDLIDLGSPVAAWIRERCELGPDHETPCADAFADFCQWCAMQGHSHKPTQTVFGQNVKTAAGVARKQKHSGAYVYKGLRLRGFGAQPG